MRRFRAFCTGTEWDYPVVPKNVRYHPSAYPVTYRVRGSRRKKRPDKST